MITGLKKIFIILFLSMPLLAVEVETSTIYENGMDAYRKGQYDLAIQEFESIISNNWNSPELYYNLGNAFYRSGNIAGAVWAFESCLKLSPTHEDAKYNLKLTNLKVIDRMDLPAPPFYLKWYLSIKERYTPSKWLNISLFILLLFALLMSASRITSFPVLRKLQGIMMTILFMILFLTLHSIWTENSYDLGIIYSPQVEARSEPNQFSTRLFEVHEGLRVSINQAVDDWVEIELLDGKMGWIEESQIRLIK
jgi:tetratricopeptide (TPR) repeat protein